MSVWPEYKPAMPNPTWVELYAQLVRTPVPKWLCRPSSNPNWNSSRHCCPAIRRYGSRTRCPGWI